MEGTFAACFVNALSTDPGFENSAPAQELFLYCLNRTSHAMPLHPGVMRVLQGITPDTQREIRLSIVDKLVLPPEVEATMQNETILEEAPDTVYTELLNILAANPAHIGAAKALLHMDFKTFRPPSAWLGNFRRPGRLAEEWRYELFLHYARRGLWAEALPLWEQLPPAFRNPYSGVYAADNYLLAGDSASGIREYTNALRRDPELYPVRLRLEALLSPPRTRPELLTEKKTAICLYSWNKG
ncbi:MAG: hypothetical protein LBO77_01275, partial [Desulfovibrio sp.]|nr:hypothetical protein [Desulfovibrio sp.]